MKTTNKTIKKILSIAICLALVMSYVPMVSLNVSAADLTVTIDTGASVTLRDADGDDYYEIGTADELYAFAAAVNGGNTSINAELTANIDLNSGYTFNSDGTVTYGDATVTSGYSSWTPIGSADIVYTGILDGANKTISGLYFNGSAEYVGFFAYMGGTIKNLNITNAYFVTTVSTSKTTVYVGGFSAYSTGNFNNCSFNGSILSNVYFVGYAGGIAAYSQGDFVNCVNNGTIISNTTNQSGCAGGIAGYSEGNIENCLNAGSVSGTIKTYGCFGGISGEACGKIIKSTNTGVVNGDTGSSSTVGGIAGVVYSNALVDRCTNKADLNGKSSGYASVGGIVGSNYGTITNCNNFGDMTASAGTFSSYYTAESAGIVGCTTGGSISFCYSVGSMTATSGSQKYPAGIVGRVYNEAALTSNFYCLDGASYGIGYDYTTGLGGDGSGKAEGKTLEQFNSGEVAYLLQQGNTEQVWGQKIGTDVLPVLSGGAVYLGYTNCSDENGTYTNDSNAVLAEKPEHKYENGICLLCDSYQPATQNSDGYYEIKNAGQLYWFAEQVNAGNTGYNAILLNDIIVNENVLVNGELNTDADAVSSFRQWTSIGNDTNKYIGTFDGQGYEIKGLYTNTAEKQNLGLFGYLAEGAVVKNLGVVDGYFADTSVDSNYGGGGSCDGGGIAKIASKATISKCYNTCTIKAGGSVGGIVGGNYSSRIEYCYNAGNVVCTAASNAPWYPAAGGIAGGNYSTATSYEIIYSCYNIGTISSGFYYIGSINGSLTGWSTQNCYYLSATDNGKGGKTAEQFASGEVAYLLQQGNTEQVWGQDNNQAGATPILDSTGLYKVVTVGETGNYSIANVGDTNGDGTVDVIDYQALVNEILSDSNEQIETANYDDIVRYDLDGDGYLDVIDAYLLHLFINGFATVDVYAVGDYDLNGKAFEEADIKAIKHAIENPEKLATYKKYASDINGDGKLDENDLTALNVKYGEVTGTECVDNVEVYYRWGNKYSTCTATAMCSLCGEKVATETINTTSETLSELTCTQDGTVKYTATFTNELFEEKVKTVTTNMLSHDLGEYADNGNGTHGLACKYCDYVDASTIEKHTYDENDKCVCGAKVAFVSTSDELLAALEQGGEIKLTGSISMPNDPSYEGFSSHVVIHLNGYDITVTQNGSGRLNPILYVVEGGSLTINGEGTVTHEGGGPSIGCIGGELTVNGGTFNNSVNVDEGGIVTINGGTFNSTVNSIDGGTATINGGTFNNRVTVTKGDTVTINGGTFNYDVDLTERDVTITGGTFNGNINVFSSTVTITGGTFDFGFDPTDYLAEGYTIVFNETDFTWTVTVAQNN